MILLTSLCIIESKKQILIIVRNYIMLSKK